MIRTVRLQRAVVSICRARDLIGGELPMMPMSLRASLGCTIVSRSSIRRPSWGQFGPVPPILERRENWTEIPIWAKIFDLKLGLALLPDREQKFF